MEPSTTGSDIPISPSDAEAVPPYTRGLPTRWNGPGRDGALGWPRQAPPLTLPEGFLDAGIQYPCDTCGTWTFRRGPLAGGCPVCLRFSRLGNYNVNSENALWTEVIPEGWIQRLPFGVFSDAVLSRLAVAARTFAPPCSPGERHVTVHAPSWLVGELLLARQWMADEETPMWAAPAADLCLHRAAFALAALCGARFAHALELTRLVRMQARNNPQVSEWSPRALASSIDTIPHHWDPTHADP